MTTHIYDHNTSSASTNQQCVDQCDDDEQTQFVMTSQWRSHLCWRNHNLWLNPHTDTVCDDVRDAARCGRGEVHSGTSENGRRLRWGLTNKHATRHIRNRFNTSKATIWYDIVIIYFLKTPFKNNTVSNRTAGLIRHWELPLRKYGFHHP